MTRVLAILSLLLVSIVHAVGGQPSHAKFFAVTGVSYSGLKECGDHCIDHAIVSAFKEARQKCSSDVEVISQWSVFHGSSPQGGYGASASAQFKCLPAVRSAMRIASK